MTRTTAVLVLLFLSFLLMGIQPSLAAYATITADLSVGSGSYPESLFGTSGDVLSNSPDTTGYSLLSSGQFGLVEITMPGFGPSDPSNPVGYNFRSIDTAIALVYKAGAQPLLAFYTRDTPANLSNYTTYVANIARHLAQGWGSGYHYPLKYFRYGNEPNNSAYWASGSTTFYRTFRAVSLALKSVDSSYVIASPALSSGGAISNGSLTSWADNFLHYCDNNNVPLDIFTMHGYGPVFYNEFYRVFQSMDSVLNSYPNLSPLYGKPRLGNDEWNIKVGNIVGTAYSSQFDTIWAGVHNVGAWSSMVYGGIDLSIRYSGPFNNPSWGFDFPMVDTTGKNPKPVFYAFKAANKLRPTTNVKVSGSDFLNFIALGGKYSGNTINILITNYDTYSFLSTYYPNTSDPIWQNYRLVLSQKRISSFPTYTGTTVVLTNLNWSNTSYRIISDRYVVDNTHNFQRVERVAFSPTSQLKYAVPLSSPGVTLLQIFLQPITEPVPVELSSFETTTEE